MKTRYSKIVIVLMLLLMLLPAHTPARSAPADPPAASDYKAGEILVRFNSGISLSSAHEVMTTHQATYIRTLYNNPVELWQVPEGQELATIAALNRDPRIAYAEPNYRYQIQLVPNDPGYTNQWAHPLMGSEVAWNTTTGSSNVTIAILDTGIDPGHPDFAGRLVAGYDFVDKDTTPNDENGHGTHVAGIAAATGNNGVGVAGLAWGANIMPVRVLDHEGSGWNSDITAGITWAADNGAQVINLSLGGSDYSQSMQNAINNATANGSLVIAAMGNDRTDGNPTSYPAAYSNVMAVASTGPNDTYAYYSQYGTHCDISAPGGAMGYLHDPNGIYSTMPTYAVYMTQNYGYSMNYDYLQGTSQATPQVAGLAALIWSVNPALTPAQVQQLIEETAVDLGSAGWDPNYGWGRINVQAAIAAIPLPPPDAPTLNAISNGEQDGNYLVNWSTVADATSYILQQADESTFRFPTVRYSGANTQFQVTDQLAGTWYYRVRASNENGDSEWSNVVSTEVLPPPPALQPIDNPSQADEYRVAWQSVLGATGYVLHEANNASFSAFTIRYTGSAIYYDVTGQRGGDWYYRVYAYYDGLNSSYSNVVSTTVIASDLDIPDLADIANNDGDGAYTITWNAVVSATGYILEEDSSPYFTSPNSVYNGPDTSYTWLDKPAGTWYYRVRAVKANGDRSPWSYSKATVVRSAVYLPLVANNHTPLIPVNPDNPIQNGGFEQESEGWTEYSSNGWNLIVHKDILPYPYHPHSGDWLAWLGGDHDEIAYIQQNVTVPTTQPYLSYWAWIDSEDLCSYDFAGVRVDNTTVESYTLCEESSTNGWTQRVVDLSAYAGQNVALQIQVETDGSLFSNLLIDDVAFQSSATVVTRPIRHTAPEINTPPPGR